MKFQQLVTSSAFAAGLGVVGVATAGTASALGFAADFGGPAGGFSVGSGASAEADEGNTAIAVSIFGNSSATAKGTHNAAIALDGVAETGEDTQNNAAYAAFGRSAASGEAANNTIVTAFGDSEVTDGTGNFITNVGSKVVASKDAASLNVATACGFQFSGQSAAVTVTNASC